MAVYKDKKRVTCYTSVTYKDWIGKQCRALKRGFTIKKETQDWEKYFTMKKASSLDMTFGDFVSVYERDVRPKLKENTWLSKENIIQTKVLPYFENKKIADITGSDIIQWQKKMFEGTNKKGVVYASTYMKKGIYNKSNIFQC